MASSKIKRRMPRETEKPPLTMIDEKPTDGSSTSKKDQDGQGMMKSENFLTGFRTQTTNWRIFFCQDGRGVMNVDFFLDRIFSTEFLGFRTHVVATTVCTTGVYTHSPVARTFFCCTVCLRTSAHLHACHTHAWLEVPRRFFAHVSRLSISPSPFSCITHLCCSCTVTSRPPSRPHVLAVLTCPKSAGHAHLRTRTISLAIWPRPPSTQHSRPQTRVGFFVCPGSLVRWAASSHRSMCTLITTQQHRTTQHKNTAQHSTTQRSTTQHNKAQHNTAQHNNITQDNTAQHSTTQHNTTHTTEADGDTPLFISQQTVLQRHSSVSQIHLSISCCRHRPTSFK